MKLVRHGEPGAEQAGMIDETGALLDLSTIVGDWSYLTLTPELLTKIKTLDPVSLSRLPEDTRLGPPIHRPGKIVGCALTYGNGPHDEVMMPKGGSELDWEAELAVVFCRAGHNIPVESAMDYVAGFCIGNDVSERVFQLERGTQWTKGKSADTLKPLGPWLVTTDEVGNPNALDISLTVNGVVMQQSNTSDMMYSIAELVSIISNYVSWQPGDIMMTGTPPGVGYGMKPPQYLKPGDIMEARIEKLGAQRNVVASYSPRYPHPQ
jgi:2-keto-4-pentenoate hydratase/2-oxohepta-3-ene-1,7-dioic acid hydratase in catechol pathway